MLVLSRRRDDEVIIGDQISVKIVEIKGNVVRLGFEAPVDILIYRKEIYDEICRENQLAASVSPEDIQKLHR